ncbi:hypothetical protein AC1031_021931 [Aphanomyces cochlioides]|nr:hypothetical protein AC1031_021931 [Aphanomyces cochlioides]
MNRASGLDSESSSEDDDDMDSVFCLTLLGYLNGCGQVERQRGGSRPGKAPNKDRRRLYPKLLFEDYWGEAPVYDGKHFRRRSSRHIFQTKAQCSKGANRYMTILITLVASRFHIASTSSCCCENVNVRGLGSRVGRQIPPHRIDGNRKSFKILLSHYFNL